MQISLRRWTFPFFARYTIGKRLTQKFHNSQFYDFKIEFFFLPLFAPFFRSFNTSIPIHADYRIIEINYRQTILSLTNELTVLVEVEDRELSGPRINEQIGRSNCLLIVYKKTRWGSIPVLPNVVKQWTRYFNSGEQHESGFNIKETIIRKFARIFLNVDKNSRKRKKY